MVMQYGLHEHGLHKISYGLEDHDTIWQNVLSKIE